MKGAKVLFLDGLRYKAHRTHFTIDEALAVAAKLNADKTYLIHMSHDIDYSETSKKLPTGVELSYDGLEVQL